MKITVSLSLLLVLTAGALLWQTWQRGSDSTRYDLLSTTIENNGAVMDELLAITADARSVLAELRAHEQQRNAQGEIRREQIREASKNDTCANTVVPAAVSDGLRHRTTLSTGKDSAAAGAAKPDGGNAYTSTDNAGHLGGSGYLERSPARCTGHLQCR